MANLNKKVEDLLQCSICTERLRDPRALPCTHTFCFDCLGHVLAPRQGVVVCPLCRQKHSLTAEGLSALPVNFLVNNLLEALEKDVPPDAAAESNSPPLPPHPQSAHDADKAAQIAVAAGAGAGIAGAVAGPAVAVAGVQAIGFGAGGIVGGSLASSMMASAAVANGGGVAAGSAVAVLQAVGATGALPLVAGGAAIVGGAVVGVAAVAAGYGVYKLVQSNAKGKVISPPQPQTASSSSMARLSKKDRLQQELAELQAKNKAAEQARAARLSQIKAARHRGNPNRDWRLWVD